MSKFRDYVFVLWGAQFDEVAATTFVAEFREAGLRVKVVGLNLRQVSGAHGLSLVPDITLDQALALADEASCVVVPYSGRGVQRLSHDPRLGDFIERAGKNQARFVVSSPVRDDWLDLRQQFPADPENIVVYPQNEDLMAFARQEVSLLLSAVPS